MMLLSLRYSFSPVARHRRRSIRIMLTAALSLSAFMLILAVMDALQGSRLDRIRDIRSFDAVVEGWHKAELAAAYPDNPVFEYATADALIEGRAVEIRFISQDYEGGVEILRGDSSSLMVPYSVYLASDDGYASIVMLGKGRSGRLLPQSSRVPISGVYTTALRGDFDNSHVFMPLSAAPEDAERYTAIKGVDSVSGYEYTGWKESESVLYSAFITERTLMIVVLSFLFVILLVSMKESIRIFYASRRSERAGLLAMGMSEKEIWRSFLLSFAIVLSAAALLSVIITMLLLPFAESYLSSALYSRADLSFPALPFIAGSAFLMLFTILIACSIQRKEMKMDIQEVLTDERT